MPTGRRLFSIITVAALFSLSACAGARPKAAKLLNCAETPQWSTKDKDGNAVGIFICFKDDSSLSYQARMLPKPQPEVAPAVSAPSSKEPVKRATKSSSKKSSPQL